ncbi:MAG: hypothetical protein V4671_06205 [Armatimonadota bacterium]
MQIDRWLLIIPAFITFFVILWLLISWFLAQSGGWAALARQFPASNHVTVPPPVSPLQAGEMNGCRYKGCLNIGVTPQGMFLSILFLFRFGHPPLLIPWSCLSPFHAEKALWMTVYTTTITGAGRDVRFTLYNKGLVDQLQGFIAHALAVGAQVPRA